MLLITCEHASNAVPDTYKALFCNEKELLQSHRGWDFGALALAQDLAKEFKAPLIAGTTSRLLIDLNRSDRDPGLFSKWTRSLDQEEKEFLLHAFHQPHWNAVRGQVRQILKTQDQILHIGVHSFTPIFAGKTRRTDIGILYDPQRPQEYAQALVWQRCLQKTTTLVVHRNRPYRGDSDGLTTSLRKEFSAGRYLGLEIEINHRCLQSAKARREISRLLRTTLAQSRSI